MKEGNVIRGPSARERKRVLVVFLFCVLDSPSFLEIRADVAIDKQSMEQLISGVCDKDLHHQPSAFIQSSVDTPPKRAPHASILNILNVIDKSANNN